MFSLPAPAELEPTPLASPVPSIFRPGPAAILCNSSQAQRCFGGHPASACKDPEVESISSCDRGLSASARVSHFQKCRVTAWEGRVGSAQRSFSCQEPPSSLTTRPVKEDMLVESKVVTLESSNQVAPVGEYFGDLTCQVLPLRTCGKCFGSCSRQSSFQPFLV